MKSTEEDSPLYYFKFGAVVIDIDKEAKDNYKNNSSNDDHSNHVIIENFYSKLLSLFKSSPSIVNIDAPEEMKRYIISSFGYSENHAIINFREPILLDCVLPERLQDIDLRLFSDLPKEYIDSSPNFKILYDGSFFTFYREINNLQGVLCGGTDARKLLNEIIKTEFNIVSTAPTPLRQDFILHTKPYEDLKGIDVEIDDFDNISIKTHHGIKNPDSFFRHIFLRNSFNLIKYYSLSSCCASINHLGYSLNEVCNNILKSRLNYTKISTFKITTKHELIKELVHLVHLFYEKYTKWSDYSIKLKTGIPLFRKYIDDPIKIIENDLLFELKPDKIPSSIYIDIVELAQKDISSYKGFSNLIITATFSLLSAILGALIVVFFSS